MNTGQQPAGDRKKQVLTKRVVQQRAVTNNSLKKASISTIISNANINKKRVTIEGNLFSNIDQIISDIKSLTTTIKIDSYFEGSINYNNDESIKSLFNKFIEAMKNIESKNQKLKKYTGIIDTKSNDIRTKLTELQNVVTSLSALGNKNTNANIRNALQKVKPTIDYNKRLSMELTKYKIKVSNELEDSEAMINNLKLEFKEVLYNKIINHYNGLIPKDKINLNVSSNSIIPNLINLSKIIKDGKKYLESINEKISMSLGNGNNYNLDVNTQSIINEKIKVISDLLNKLEVTMKDAIQTLKNKTTSNIKSIRERIAQKIRDLIKAIKDCISKIKSNKNTQLQDIKKELETLKAKFSNETFHNFKNMFKENNNTKMLETKLNSILINIEKLFNRTEIKNNIQSRPNNLPNVTGSLGRPLAPPVVNNSEQNNNTNFMGKKYRNMKNSNKLEIGKTYLWNGSQPGQVRTGMINRISKNGTPFFKNLTTYQNKSGKNPLKQKGDPQAIGIETLKKKHIKVPI